MKRDLERVEIPEEHGARERAWKVLQSAFADREPVEHRPNRLRPALAFAAALAVVAAALSPPGRAVIDEIREAVGVKRAQPALFSLPAPGKLLVASDEGVWVVQQDGSKRLLGDYREASWSPYGRFVVAARANELAALEPDGDVRWTLARPGVRSPRWTGTEADTRIAYIDRTGLRVIAGDGSGDRLLARGASGPLAWQPGGDFVLAYVASRDIVVFDVAAGRAISRYRPRQRIRSLAWSLDGRWLLGTTRSRLVLHSPEAVPVNVRGLPSISSAGFGPDETLAVLRDVELATFDPQRLQTRPRRLFAGAGPFEGLAWSPNGRWLLLGWPAADQWVFVRGDGRSIRAVANVSEQFRSGTFPRIEGWCCAG